MDNSFAEVNGEITRKSAFSGLRAASYPAPARTTRSEMDRGRRRLAWPSHLCTSVSGKALFQRCDGKAMTQLFERGTKP